MMPFVFYMCLWALKDYFPKCGYQSLDLSERTVLKFVMARRIPIKPVYVQMDSQYLVHSCGQYLKGHWSNGSTHKT